MADLEEQETAPEQRPSHATNTIIVVLAVASKLAEVVPVAM
jgi:hypothetical protein